ncbi:MAG: PEP-CTERM sorting domain-containing protein [Verrucomicrobiota bacterium]
MRIRNALILLALTAGLLPLSAPAAFTVPSFRGTGEYSAWDIFYDPASPSPQTGNYPDVAAPNGIKQTRSAAGIPAVADYNPADPAAFWNAANPTISQTDASAGAFIIGPGLAGGGNIYSFSKATSFLVTDSTPYTAQNVLFQFLTSGTEIDYSTIRLNYDNGGAPASLFPTFTAEISRAGAGGPFGGGTVEYAAQWNLSGLGISSYTISFAGGSSSVSFQAASLDTSPAAFVQAVPEPAAGLMALLGAAGMISRRRRASV